MGLGAKHSYEELEVVEVPEEVPALGVLAGTRGVVVDVYAAGRMLLVEIGLEDGSSAGFVDLEVEESGMLRVVGYSAHGGALATRSPKHRV